MQGLPRRLSPVTSRGAGGDDPPPTAALEFVSASAAVAATPIPRFARGVVFVVSSMFAAWGAALGLIQIDRVVTAPGRVVSNAATIVVQALDTAIIRSIEVREGQQVRAGELLARLDPTFAAADVGALQSQVSSLSAEVSRLEAEMEGRPFSGSERSLSLQATIYAQRAAERTSKLESYHQKIEGLNSAVARSAAEAAALREWLAVAHNVEGMRKQLEQLQAGSRLNSLIATDHRLEIERNLSTAVKTGETTSAELAGMIAERDAYLQNWRSQTGQALSEQSRKLNDAREALSKATLRRQLVELRADRDATVLTVAKVSRGSILQPGEELMTMVPADAPLEIEANVSGRDNGFVHVGDPVAIKFDTFPFSQYGMATGSVRVISPDSFTASDQQVGRTMRAVPVPQSSIAPFYRSRIAIERVGLHDVPAHFRLMPGMPVTAEVMVGRHTVLDYLLGRIVPVVLEGMREP